MALTVAFPSDPSANYREGELLGLKARIVDLTFDSSYLTTGEVLTPAQMGWDTLYGAVALTHPKNSTGTLGLPTTVSVNAAGNLAFQPLESAGDGDPMDEAGSTNNLSAFTGRFIVLGL